MRYFFFVLLLLLFSCKKETENIYQVVRMGVKPSVVDTLKDPRSIELFLYERDTNYYSFQLRPLTQYVSKHNPKESEIVKQYAAKNKLTKTVYKADYDNNGYTDLLLIGAMEWPREQPPGDYPLNLLVLNYGGNTDKVIPVSFSHFSPYLIPKCTVKNGEPLIQVDQFVSVYGRDPIKKQVESKLLTVKDTALIEYNAKPGKYNIEKIQFATTPCFGTCSVFEIHINKNKEAVFIADAYNFSHEHSAPKEEKAFKATLDAETYNKLTNLISYLDFPNLNDNYAVTWTDSASSILIITYNNGKVKRIEDYGLQGTFGLMSLYGYFKDLRFNQKWIETQEPKGMRINTWMKDME